MRRDARGRSLITASRKDPQPFRGCTARRDELSTPGNLFVREGLASGRATRPYVRSNARQVVAM